MTSTRRSPTPGDTADDPGDTADEPADPTSSRLDETRKTLSRLVGGARSMDAGRTLLRVGAVATPLGFLFIVLGYWGAAHAPREIQQTPYLISGGLLGVALVFAGGFAYFAHWLSRGVAQQQRIIELLNQHTEQVAARLASFEDRLAAPSSAPASTPRSPTHTTGNGDVPTLLVTPTGSIAHRPECPVVANRSDAKAVAPGDELRGCKICRPLDVTG